MLGTKEKRWTRRRLIALGIPAVLIPGLLIAMALGWNPVKLENVKGSRKIPKDVKKGSSSMRKWCESGWLPPKRIKSVGSSSMKGE